MVTVTRQANGSNFLIRSHRPSPTERNTDTAARPAAAVRTAPQDMKSSAAAADVDLELRKAVAQAWHAQSGNPRPSRASRATGGDDEAAGIGARPRGGAARYRQSRFKLEALAASAAVPPAAEAPAPRERPWDFTRSLWDTYELVSVARKLESGLVITDFAVNAPDAVREGGSRADGKRSRESRRSLRRLLLRSSSRSFE